MYAVFSLLTSSGPSLLLASKRLIGIARSVDAIEYDDVFITQELEFLAGELINRRGAPTLIGKLSY